MRDFFLKINFILISMCREYVQDYNCTSNKVKSMDYVKSFPSGHAGNFFLNKICPYHKPHFSKLQLLFCTSSYTWFGTFTSELGDFKGLLFCLWCKGQFWWLDFRLVWVEWSTKSIFGGTFCLATWSQFFQPFFR